MTFATQGEPLSSSERAIAGRLKIIDAAIEAVCLARKGIIQSIVFLTNDELVNRYGGIAVKCGSCVALCDHKKDRQAGWCSEHRCMVSSSTPVLCTRYARKG